MMHVCYFLHDKTGHYSKLLGTSVRSLLDNTSAPLTIHLLCFGRIASQVLDRFRSMVQESGQKLCLYDLTEYHSQVVSMLPTNWLELYSPAAANRLFFWDFLPKNIDRVIWLDADTIIHMDIADLWKEEVGENGFAAVVDDVVVNFKDSMLFDLPEFDGSRYVNSGVILMERKRFCIPNWKEKVVRFFERFPLASYADQDVLNYYYHKKGRLLPARYNKLVTLQQLRGIKDIEPGIYHYAGSAYNLNASNPYMRLFFKYFTRTPWYDMNFLERLLSVLPIIHDGRTIMLRESYTAIAGRRKVVVGEVKEEEKIRNIMQMNSDEPYLAFIPGEKKQNIDVMALASQRTESVFLLFSGSYMDLREEFIKNGCIEGRDFINGDYLLTFDEGCPALTEHEIFMQL